MYLSTRSLAAAGRQEVVDAEVQAQTRTGHEPNVWYLGLTSMFTDISSEMVSSVLPLYLTLLLGFGPLGLGIFDGAYNAFTAVASIAAALSADRGRRHKLLAGIGYVISALCTAGLIVARGAWLATVSLIYLTKLGKGIRTAPRDALISMSVVPARLGRAFGLHRAFDTIGAVAGPVVASLLLARDPVGYLTVFTVGFFVAVIGAAVLVLFVQPVPSDDEEDRRPRLTVAGIGTKIAAAVRHRRFRLVLIAGFTLALVRPGDSLLFLAFQRDSSVTTAQFPLLYSAASVTFLLAAAPLGVLADRIGRLQVYVLGELAVVGTLAVLAFGGKSLPGLVGVLALVGISYAATDGVLVALASAVLPKRWRTTGLAVVAAVVAVGRFLASAGFGAAWERFGSTAAAVIYLVGSLVALGIGIMLVRRDASGSGPDGADGMAPADPTPHLEAV